MPILLTAEDITSAIIRIDAAAQGVNSAFQSCPKLDAGTKHAWDAWYAGWQHWADTNNNLSHFTPELSSIGDQTIAYENDVAGWQEDADRICGAQIPILVPQTVSADTAGWSHVLSAVKWVAGAVIAGLVIPPVVEAVHAYHAERKAKKAARTTA